MAIFRICSDDAHYLNFVEDATDVEQKLGRDHPFHIDPRPKRYAHLWKEPLKVTLYYGNYNKGKRVPDIAENGGRIYLNQRVYETLYPVLEDAGEFLPVFHEEGEGYLFNPLMSAEDVDGVEEVFYDEHDNMIGYRFDEKRVKDLPIFRTEVDGYQGIFCSEAVKETVEASAFKGVRFTKHYSDLFRISKGLFD